MNPDDSSQMLSRPSLLVIGIWIVFISGLLLQLLSPHLGIEHDSFVIPDTLARHGATIDPRALVVRERTIQLCSAALVLTGAIGLAVQYRTTLRNCFR